ncbi:TIGR03089 family protein [Actinotalea sp.]|uniref:TIGR03089 family protein n=1 Tax=Actinotalea sp. TaxID=1872145 RepID=UPI003566148A
MSSVQPIGDLLDRLRRDPGRPRVTWYDADERVELSGHVLDNWVSKTTNLLVEELDLGPGRTAVVDLPGHWRAVVWWLAVLRTGARLSTTSAADPHPDVVITADASSWPTAPELVVVTLPALARRADGPLPPGAIDAAAAVMTYGDALGPVVAPPSDSPALHPSAGGPDVSFEDLTDWAARTADLAALAVPSPAALAPAPGPRRVLIAATGPLDGLLAACLAVLGADGSVILCSADLAAALAEDPARLERLRAGERVTD